MPDLPARFAALIITLAPLLIRRSWMRACVLSWAPWSARDGARIMLGHLVRAFAPRDPVVVGLNDTIERRWGPKIAARGIYRYQWRTGGGWCRRCPGRLM